MEDGLFTMLVLYGPTAAGKTDLAINLAKKFDGEIISADSRQVYEELDIGTGKVSFESITKKHTGYWIVDDIKIKGYDLVKPGENFSVANFLRFASSSIVQTIELKKMPILVGGTGFYIKALIDGIETIGIPPNFKLRRKLEKLSVPNLHEKLLELDYEHAIKMNESDRQNPRRLIRALEIRMSKKNQTTNHQLPTTNCRLIGLTAPNKYLYAKADRWLEIRLRKGMIDEVKKLIKKVDPKWLENLGLEYRWTTRYLKGKIDFEEAKTGLRGDIHAFIRRQKTFLNQFGQKDIYDISQKNWQSKLEKKVSLWYTRINGRIKHSSQS